MLLNLVLKLARDEAHPPDGRRHTSLATGWRSQAASRRSAELPTLPTDGARHKRGHGLWMGMIAMSGIDAQDGEKE